MPNKTLSSFLKQPQASLSPSQHPSFHWSYHWFGGHVSPVFPSEADARGDPPNLACGHTQQRTWSPYPTCCFSSHSRYSSHINIWNATSAALSQDSLPTYVKCNNPFPSRSPSGLVTNVWKEREKRWRGICFPFPLFSFSFVFFCII